jgi:hypothetical protein
MRTILHSEEKYKDSRGSGSCVHFYENIEMPGYYMVDVDGLAWGMRIYHIHMKTGKFDLGSGFPQLNIKEPVSVGEFNHLYIDKFHWFILDNFVEEHLPHERGILKHRAWYKFKSFEPEKWLDDFLNYMKDKEKREYEKINSVPVQLNLFD